MGFIGIKTFSSPTEQVKYANDQRLERNAKEILVSINNYYKGYKQLPWDVTYEYNPPEKIGNPAKTVSSYKWVNELTGSGNLRNPEFLNLDKLYIWRKDPVKVENIKICFLPQSKDFKNKLNADENGNEIKTDPNSADSINQNGKFYCVTTQN